MPTKPATIPAMMTVRAEQGTIVTRNDAMMRSRREWRSRTLMMAGTLHPNARVRGMTAPPCMPTRCMALSARKAARVMYPESSRTDMMM
ncbi:MAG: hypothetical protein BWX50_01427 [Euryarchaeota archaeon ADurb.Bin009]|nr:MAG: hypothetical protein BWX50_01427 [Euryarchaeota archaeon ADurb.Bin009]